jgi:DeoR/GlpR family transcriptional regulator of sugar metabolism
MAASTKERREAIVAKVYEAGHVTVKDLAGELGVSEATVRRDVRALADRGRLETVYGGAVPPRNSDFSFRSKSMRNVEAKRAIGRLAAELVGDGEQVFLDSGTTAFQMAPLLKLKRGLSVIVNSARLAMELDTPGLRVVLLGGHYRPDRMDTTGPLATAALDQLHGYVCFVGADGVSMDIGLTASDVESAELFRLAIRNARESILLVDHSKFLAPSLFKIVEWEPIRRVVTDRRPGPQWLEFFQRRGVGVVCPQADAGADGAWASSAPPTE